MAQIIEPMRAVSAAALPTDADAWGYEVKWDGYRVVAHIEGGALRLHTRTGLDATTTFAFLGPLAEAMAPLDAVLDGEVVAFDDTGRPSFAALQQRGHRAAAIHYVIFDLLELDGRATCSLPYVARRALLDQLDLRGGPVWDVPAFQQGPGAGVALVEATAAQGLEGIVAKRLDSIYEPGRRSRNWVKVKHWASQELVIGGWLPGKGMRAGGLGSLLVGVHDASGALRYSGRVGTGFTDAELARLGALLEPLARPTSPFATPPPPPPEVRRLGRFVDPVLVAEVAFSEWTESGTVRQPAYKGLRDDVDPRRVVRE